MTFTNNIFIENMEISTGCLYRNNGFMPAGTGVSFSLMCLDNRPGSQRTCLWSPEECVIYSTVFGSWGSFWDLIGAKSLKQGVVLACNSQ